MSTLQDALVNAKLATEKQVEQAKKEQVKQDKPEPKPKREDTVHLDSQFDSFEKLFTNEKSKPFLIHLLHSFLPFPDNHIIWDWNEKTEWKNGKKCCICQLETLSKQDIFEHLNEWTEISLESIRKEVEAYSANQPFNTSEYIHQHKERIFGKRLLGVTSERTSCIICHPCYELFSNWVPTRMLREGGFGEFSKIISYVWQNKKANWISHI